MNIFQLVIKQMRQRSLSTWLTILSVALGVALAIAIMILRREGQAMFGQSDYGYDVLVGAKGSPLQLTLNTIYHIDRSPGNIPYALYEAMLRGEYRPQVKTAVPFAVGDTFRGHRIIGTLPKLFGVDDEGNPIESPLEYRPGQRYELAQGRVFHPRKFEAIVGSDVPRLTGLSIGGKFKATHGSPAPNQSVDEHDTEWEIVGVLEPTHTAADRVLFIPLMTFYAISEHEHALEAQSQLRQGAALDRVSAPKPVQQPAKPTQEEAHHDHDDHDGHAPATTEAGHDDHDHAHDEHDEHDEHEEHEEHAEDEHAHRDHDETFSMNADGTIDLRLPKDQLQVSAILVKSRSPFAAQQLMYVINNRNEAAAVNPASVMREFFANFLDNGARVLLLISLLVIIVAAASILTTIYNSVSARRREIAILRALGATRNRVLTLICLEATLIGLIGGIAGLVIGHLIAAAGSVYMERLMGESIDWLLFTPNELVFLLFVVGIAFIAGLVPGLKAYSTPVATNLTNS